LEIKNLSFVRNLIKAYKTYLNRVYFGVQNSHAKFLKKCIKNGGKNHLP